MSSAREIQMLISSLLARHWNSQDTIVYLTGDMLVSLRSAILPILMLPGMIDSSQVGQSQCHRIPLEACPMVLADVPTIQSITIGNFLMMSLSALFSFVPVGKYDTTCHRLLLLWYLAQQVYDSEEFNAAEIT